ncbi:MAG: hypothetical protein AABX05_03540, partial [Nanoarchaeota archaeon]
AGFVGLDCPDAGSASDCNNLVIQDLKSVENAGCWVMANQYDWSSGNGCGQAVVSDGTIVSVSDYAALSITDSSKNKYLSKDNDIDPKNLFSDWVWKSKAEYGSLICNKGFWHACQSNNEGKSFPDFINGEDYVCKDQEWVVVTQESLDAIFGITCTEETKGSNGLYGSLTYGCDGVDWKQE